MTLRTRPDDLDPFGIPRTIVEKWCPGCARWKAVRHFHRDRHAADGHYRVCKTCRRPIQAAAYRRKAEARRAGVQAWRSEHVDYARERDRRRYHTDIAASRERKREAARRFRERHRERVNAQKRAAYAANAELERAAARLRRERKEGAGR